MARKTRQERGAQGELARKIAIRLLQWIEDPPLRETVHDLLAQENE